MPAPRTHCVHGHPLTDDNVVIKTRDGQPFRKCRTCKRREVRDHNRRVAARTAEHKPGWNAVQREIYNGRLVRQACQECGEPRTHAHHPNGYVGEAATVVVWLCPRHHAEAHKKMLLAVSGVSVDEEGRP